VILRFALLLSLMVLVAYWVTVRQAVIQLKTIDPITAEQERTLAKQGFPKVSVIVPAFNEEDNIESCVRSILESSHLSYPYLDVIVIDDQSTDRTWAILQRLKEDSADSRLNIYEGLPRPIGQQWTGKNWACYQGAQRAEGAFFFFIDADVRLKPGAIAAVVQTAYAEKIDLLTCIPTIFCGSLIEYLVQPLIFINLLITFNSDIVKDPNTKITYALGPFLVFNSATYQKIGGHEAVARDVAEDVAFARLIKQNGFKLQHALGPKLASLRMYRNLSTLWEGWTKVLYVGAHRSIIAMGLLVFAMITAYIFPWVGLAIALSHLVQTGALIAWVEVGLAGIAVTVQYAVRAVGSSALGTLSRYWWLQSLGGLLIAVMAIVSIIKAETGWGWTWRGRSLK
jgi:glycosyltransferase involved in cell wall biosynthesis